jgi:hypothetical protein
LTSDEHHAFTARANRRRLPDDAAQTQAFACAPLNGIAVAVNPLGNDRWTIHADQELPQ